MARRRKNPSAFQMVGILNSVLPGIGFSSPEERGAFFSDTPREFTITTIEFRDSLGIAYEAGVRAGSERGMAHGRR